MKSSSLYNSLQVRPRTALRSTESPATKDWVPNFDVEVLVKR
jgi:hypothetical protein